MTQPTSGGAVTAVTNCCANCVEPSRPQQCGPDLPFWSSRPCGSAGWLALLLTIAGDVETNPDQTTLNTSKHHSKSKTKLRHEHRHIIQTHLTSLNDSKTLEKTLLPYITTNIPHIYTQHGFKSNHSTSTALHNINNTIETGFKQNKQPERTITVALDMSKAFDTVNIHALTHKLHQTNIPHIIIKYIANYIKGRKAYTTFRNKTST